MYVRVFGCVHKYLSIFLCALNFFHVYLHFKFIEDVMGLYNDLYQIGVAGVSTAIPYHSKFQRNILS